MFVETLLPAEPDRGASGKSGKYYRNVISLPAGTDDRVLHVFHPCDRAVAAPPEVSVVEGDALRELHLWRMRRDVFKPAGNGNGPNGPDRRDVDPQLTRAIEYMEKEIGDR